MPDSHEPEVRIYAVIYSVKVVNHQLLVNCQGKWRPLCLLECLSCIFGVTCLLVPGTISAVEKYQSVVNVSQIRAEWEDMGLN